MKLKMLGAILAGTAFLLGGCAGVEGYSRSTRSSLVEFLYPQTEGYVATTAIPHLQLPLRVGVAFTPIQMQGPLGLSEVDKKQLAENVAAEFRQHDFIGKIEIIPSDYLRPGGSFSNLDQLRQLFGIDVIVLLSYDQSVFVSEGLASLTYWTIVGAYVIPGEKNDTQTLLDAAVYDIGSRSLLFRAPGTSVVKSRGTLIENAKQQREDSTEGFQQAAEQLGMNLTREMESFKLRIREQPQQYQVSRREGYTGSGSNDAFFVLLSVLAGLLFRRSRQGRA